MKRFWGLLAAAAFVTGCTESPEPVRTDITLNLIPKPVSVQKTEGRFELTSDFHVVTDSRDSSLIHIARFLAEELRLRKALPVIVDEIPKRGNPRDGILLSLRKAGRRLGDEGYSLAVHEDGLVLRANEPAGLFYGAQTLLQMIPDRDKLPVSGSWIRLPCVDVEDRPRYPYRGMHLDVSRHFFPKSFIKKYIDIMAMHKMNTFHWHLVDDQGWRIEIKRYPRLTEVGAWRVDRSHLDWNERPPQKPGEKAAYGGYYTQEDIREIVQYAKDRFVTIIPEIEMPAHITSALAAYPELSCTEGPFTVPPGGIWPSTAIYCAGKEKTFVFLENVLKEVMDLFPGPYVHIGGDEAVKTEWERCPLCQARIEEEGLDGVHELQSYFIKRIEKFVNAHGRRIIGWDEILEGGLPPHAAVMSWRGVQGGIEAARMGHEVIMTPTSHCYFDYYQGDPEFEPKAIGGYTPLKKVYAFEPAPPELTEREASRILGAQGNLWTEYIPTPEHAQYMALPRLIALSEVVWSPAEIRNWTDFRTRLQAHKARLDRRNILYAPGSFRVEVRTRYDERTDKVYLVLESEQPDPDIRYTLDGTRPKPVSPRYVNPVLLRQSARVQTCIFQNNERKGRISVQEITLHKGMGKPIQWLRQPSPRYGRPDAGLLTDGLMGSLNHENGSWMGFEGSDMEIILDLKTVMPLHRVSAGFLQSTGAWIFLPEKLIVETSKDGISYTAAADLRHPVSVRQKSVYHQFSAGIGDEVRYLRITARNRGTCPESHPGAGEPAWIFCDEIIIK